MALIVEDGTGLATAESYLSVADFDTYWSLRTTDPVYTEAALGTVNATQKEEALRVSTQEADAENEIYWKGDKATSLQGLDWPRFNAFDNSGHAYDSSAIPVELEAYIAERSARYMANITTGLIPDLDSPAGDIVREKIKAGPVELDTSYSGGASAVKTFAKLDTLIQSLTIGGGGVVVRA
tara:strand:- start:50975 stop:51517 length:543 start_codon:yes stop_codon:yes gene_type:complete